MPRIAKHRPSHARPKPTRGARLAKWLGSGAFFLSLLLVIVRVMMNESLRSSSLGLPGDDAPRGPGPSTAVLLDLLFSVPALLVLFRRAVLPGARLRCAWSMLPMGLLGIWTALSPFWADDKFAAAVSAANWCSALIFVWSTAQLVDSWVRLRWVAGVCFGLGLVLIAAGLNYRFIDWPDLKREWAANSAQMLHHIDKEPGSRDAEQFSKNIESGTPLGFSSSANTYAALLVLTMTVGGGVAVQRRKNGDAMGWTTPMTVCALPAAMLLYWSQSKAACATAALATAGLAAIAWKSERARLNGRIIYRCVLGLFLTLMVAVVAYGSVRHSLPTSSLAFRWHYWVGAARLFKHHPWIGVGWDNFGPHYLAFRLPVAPEEIRDPHNFVIRAFVELGFVGGLLLCAWILRLGWELAAPRISEDAPRQPDGLIDAPGRAFRTITQVAVAAIILNLALALDWSTSGAYLLFEVIKRLIFAALLAGGIGVVILRRARSSEGPPARRTITARDFVMDERPATPLRGAMILAIGLFLMQNLIDFSISEPAGSVLFAIVVGAALGVVSRGAVLSDDVNVEGGLSSGRMGWLAGRRVAVTASVAGSLAWCIAAGALAAPTFLAESAAASGDTALRDAMSLRNSAAPEGAAKFDPAAADLAARAAANYQLAFLDMHCNGDYADRAGHAWALAGEPDRAMEMFAAAIAADPSSGRFLLDRARLARARSGVSLIAVALAGFEQALQLDPNNVAVRIEYARFLQQSGRPVQARQQYQIALDYDGQLSHEENKRLSPARVREVQEEIAQLSAPPPK